MRVAPIYANRTMYQSHFIVRVAFYASRIPIVQLHCASRTLFESHVSPASRILILRVAF